MQEPPAEPPRATPAPNRWKKGLIVLESVAVLMLFVLPLTQIGVRSVVWAVLATMFWGMISFFELLVVDTWGTLVNGLGLVARVALVAAPAVVFVRRVRRHRLVWLAPYGLLLILFLPASPFAITSMTDWLLLAIVSVGSTLVVRARWLRWCIVAPLVFILLSPAILHHLIPGSGRLLLSLDEIGGYCAEHEGTPITPPSRDENRLGYYSVTSVTADLLLLIGDNSDGSWWLSRSQEGEFSLSQPSEVRGNLWRGCLSEGKVWFTNSGDIVGVAPPDGPGSQELVEHIVIPDEPGVGFEFDMVGVGCDLTRQTVYFGEVSQGGLWELDVDGGLRRIEMGGLILLPAPLPSGQLAVGTTSRVKILDPDRSLALQSIPSAITSNGMDVCPSDGAIAVSDVAGRVRLFEADDAGTYRFSWGIGLAAPRRVAFSPDCSEIAVTSGNDRTVWMVERRSGEIRCEFEVGPGLRDVTYVDAETVAVADVCGAVLLACDTEP